MIELAVKYGIKAISLEKPMAESMKEAKAMKDLCVRNGIKAVVRITNGSEMPSTPM